MIVSECPQCGAPAAQRAKQCEYCKSPFTIDSLTALATFDHDGVNQYIQAFKKNSADASNLSSVLGLGLCYLNIQNYTLANIQFRKLIDLTPETAESYYYLAISMMRGRRIKIISLKEIREIEELLITAQELNPEDFKYDILLAAIKYDYYRISGLIVASPEEDELIQQAIEKGIDQEELDTLLKLIVVDNSFIINLLSILNL